MFISTKEDMMTSFLLMAGLLTMFVQDPLVRSRELEQLSQLRYDHAMIKMGRSGRAAL
jgi:hypothetical protein